MTLREDFRKFARSNSKVSMAYLDDKIKYTEDRLAPYILEQTDLRATPIDIYSRLLFDRIIYFSGVVDDESCNAAIAQLLYLQSTDERDIAIYINSPRRERCRWFRPH